MGWRPLRRLANSFVTRSWGLRPRLYADACSAGSIAVGKQADLMIVKGNPVAKISDIENVEIVFKDGGGYDLIATSQMCFIFVGVFRGRDTSPVS